MKTLLKNFLASTALDRGDKSRNPSECDEAKRFAESMHAMERDLRESCASGPVPAGLHTSIMRAVQKTSIESGPLVRLLSLRRLAVMALVLLVGLGVFWSVNRRSVTVVKDLPSTEVPLSFAVAFDQGHELTQAAPGAVLGPLSIEMELLNRDFHNAVTFLADSMP